ncbi:MAG TPA: pyruvate dehydrogenase (acetyl-transferring) E1 component subunit alpha [archaeon]|nr:pyruvate dehydrogenase (acetyl-transferring) E1 component subunit alpha [archaeon]
MPSKYPLKIKSGSKNPIWNSTKTFEIKTLQILDEKGNLVGKLPKLASADVKKVYRFMVLSRIFDEKMLALQRQGRIGTFASIKGQEASNVGIGYAMSKEDWLFPSFREHGTSLVLGLPMENILLYYGGDERGSKIPENVNSFPVTVPVSTQALHAVGFAWAQKLQKKKSVSITVFGDGATSEGDFHEAMNFAGVFKLPVVFVCQNNQWAISVPRERQSASETLAQKAIAYGFEGVQVDGNDVFAVYQAVKEALEKARKGGGPTLVECFTYRISDHTTSDDWKKYRDEKEVEMWKKKDPIDRLRKYMESKKLWKKSDEKKLLKACEKLVEQAVKKFESTKPPEVEDIFKYTYKEMTPELVEQMEKLKEGLR